MRTVFYLLQKEFVQIFRNRAMLPILFAMPVIQLLVLSYAATFEVRDTPMSVIDQDRSLTSRQLVDRLVASGYFTLVDQPATPEQADAALRRGEVKLIVHVPPRFERDLLETGAAPVRLVLDALDGATAGVVQAYATQVLARVSRDVQARTATAAARPAPRIEVRPAFWYNPDLNYETYMVPGILVVLVTMIATFLSAMNVVREKEIGTIEQLNVTPIRKGPFLIGKLLPFWLIALVELGVGLAIARWYFHVPMLGNLALVFGLAGLYLLAMLGLGLWISTMADTQQQAMFIAWFVLVIFILMSGLFTPIESMPAWAQRLTLLNPMAHFITIMRRVLLKGAGLDAVRVQTAALLLFGTVLLTLAVRQYRKVTT
ncbi:MAG: ABC transporter permease [Bacteroidetes bacterium]|nr:MAG: ABC transporter permease [Bacteroidota bacterium]